MGWTKSQTGDLVGKNAQSILVADMESTWFWIHLRFFGALIDQGCYKDVLTGVEQWTDNMLHMKSPEMK